MQITYKSPKKDRIAAQIETLNALLELQDLSDSIELTYAELAAHIAAGTLIPSAAYLITDYQTVHTIPYTEDTNTAPVEPLLVTAIAADKISPVAFSPAYPQDIIYYNPSNDQTMVPGCTKGFIYRRIDTKQINDFPFDFRNAKFRRFQIEITTQDSDGNDVNYTKGKIVKKTGTTQLYVKLNDDTAKLFTDKSAWRLFEWADLSYASPFDSEWSLISSDFELLIRCSGLHQDFHFFANPNHYNSAFFNKIEANMAEVLINFNSVCFGVGFTNNSIGVNFTYNSIGAYFNNNIIGTQFQNNSIGANFSYNSIGAYFINNSITSGFGKNSIGYNFSKNSIGPDFINNSIGPNFETNSIGNDFSSNIIAAYCSVNTFGESFAFNSVGSYFETNIIKNLCKYNDFAAKCFENIIANNFNRNYGRCFETDFTSATHVYQEYSCDFLTNNANTKKLTYLNGTTLTIVNAND